MELIFDEVMNCLKQRLPVIMVDRVLEVEPGKRIKTVKNVTGNELQFMGYFEVFTALPNAFIVESIGQSASILFSLTEGTSLGKDEFLALAAVSEMQFIAPVIPGHRMVVDAIVMKMLPTMALIVGSVSVDGNIICNGKLSFAKIMDSEKAE